ncbi:hypothetical protein ACJJIC_18410 [Microbulbifer sp. ANSA002]|uniref:hypothetical protein n=1 Tax=unclassified Microbulbifer TaxID=2619833 RepID=UPI004041C8B5
MEESKNNNFTISAPVNNSTISVSQNQDGNQSVASNNIEYVIAEESCRIENHESLSKSQNIFNTTVALSVIAILADVAGLMTYIGIDQGVLILVLAPIAWFVTWITSEKRWMRRLPQNNTAHFKDGEWYQKLPNDDVAIFLKKAKCTFPKCKGTINIVPAPAREHPNHSLVGKCSVGGLQHTYTVDFNGIGYPREFDWRSPPNPERGNT